MSSSAISAPESPAADAAPRRRIPDARPGAGMLSVGVVGRREGGGRAAGGSEGFSDPGSIAARRRRISVRPEKKAEKKKRSRFGRLIPNTLLLLVLLLLPALTVLKWTGVSLYRETSPLAMHQHRARLSGVEAQLKETTKQLEDRIKAMDNKVGGEIVNVMKELVSQIEEKGAAFGKELKKLEGRTDDLDKSLEELRGSGLVSREEYQCFLNELREAGILEGGNAPVSLDDIRALARGIVEKEMEKHAGDGLGRVDYAVASAGAKVVSHSEAYEFGKGKSWIGRFKTRSAVHPRAEKMLLPSFGEPGQCFALNGSQGFVEIRLRTAIIPEAVTLEHVHKSVAYDRSSAPKDCQVFGWLDDSVSKRSEMVLLTRLTYELERSNAQTFNIEISRPLIINMVRFEFSSNHGSSSLTCLYRLRIHGSEPDSSAATAILDS